MRVLNLVGLGYPDTAVPRYRGTARSKGHITGRLPLEYYGPDVKFRSSGYQKMAMKIAGSAS